ncbi:DUF3011 domain-containing protein [Stenotrophomonas maltophilia]|uniref:DUF3011 domain-containing protein n=1 Tax=Stenotrophomonas maltophilia TaxID=40324 RepID=UPI000C26B464|nr:DUF3011 domain-containing protein [Stenotrophomonas maltophilia]MBA0395702.1 DUF3011 domain-containing protein [Stenotrophomonas maltophilia]PJL02835.1 hypothetical protein B9Y63_12965 [Stenotrophomonas maltophilia]PJL42172.1 hypothetical protein B9Y56_15515 [Stenotrophomonas maltophilia]BBO52471.1 hypothetical protein KMM349_28020 [Stenotrophomonas maltophilia]
MTHRLLLPIAGTALALLLAATAVAAQDYDADHIPVLRCESQFNKTQQCPIEGRVRLAKQLSVTRCVEDRNWGQSRRMLWVTDGCRAEFVADEQGRGRWPGRGRDRDDDGERLVCESYEKKEKECRIRVRRDVRLVKQKSVTTCIEDRNWGWDRRGVWVSDGCRAEFRVY